MICASHKRILYFLNSFGSLTGNAFRGMASLDLSLAPGGSSAEPKPVM